MRYAAEQRSTELMTRVETWRTRAEERANRIDRLVAERPGPLLGWLRPKASPSGVVASSAPTHIEQDRDARAFPFPGLRSIRVASLVSTSGLGAALDVMDRREITDRASIDDVDLVVVDSVSLDEADDAAALRYLLTRDTGPPVVVWTPPTDPPEVTDALRIEVSLPPSFDSALHSPATRWQIDQPEFIAVADRVRFPDSALVEHAAAGGVVIPDASVEFDEVTRSAASAVARRWAYRNHAPWVRARQLTDAAGIGTYDPWPSVAGILVSNRPDLVPSAIRNMAGQSYGRFEIVVGLHGISDVGVIAQLAEQLGIASRTQIIHIPKSETLGRALNICIDRANADVIAKIDDDDAYGPSYIEDAVHALAYSGAAIVGKATQFTYFSGRDFTVLRRPGTEETFVDGTTTGASLVFRRGVWEATRFPHRPRQVDVHFVRGARLAGADVYAASRWEFRYFRGHDQHTWKSNDEALLAGAVPMFEGDDPARVHASGWPLDGE